MNWPLMRNNVTARDAHDAAGFLLTGDYPPQGQILHGPDSVQIPVRLTQGDQVAAFEREFAQWLGCKHAVMVNSGSSANLITMAALRDRGGPDEIIVPTITWVSDIAAVLHAGFKPVFVDIDPYTLGMDWKQVFRAINKNTRAVFVTHVLGFNAFTQERIAARLDAMNIDLIEDCCEATGATMNGKKLGTFGLASNFSFYYAHHMSTIEGGMVCTNDESLYQRLRQFRSHGLVRERTDVEHRRVIEEQTPDLDPQFIFSVAGFNVRSTEINAVIGRSQLKRLDANNAIRARNLGTWLSSLDPTLYQTEYAAEGASNYALPLVLVEPNTILMDKVIDLLTDEGVEYRRGTAGGGNQLRQPYLRNVVPLKHYEKFPQTEHVHFFGLYVGNYPELHASEIESLCVKLNAL